MRAGPPYHHSQIMTTKVLDDSEIIDYADHHSGTVSPGAGRLNPYKLGMELFRSIEERWNKGKFGPEYERCENLKEKLAWDRKLGLGRKKIFEVRKLYNDVTFLDAFLDEDFCHQHKLFMYGYNPASKSFEIVDRDFKKVKAKLLHRLTNMGQPRIDVVDGNAFNRGELTLKHQHDGVDLRQDWAWEVLRNMHRIWKRPVHIETIVDGTAKILSFDGEEKKEQRAV
jgi:stage V sporulation protein R